MDNLETFLNQNLENSQNPETWGNGELKNYDNSQTKIEVENSKIEVEHQQEKVKKSETCQNPQKIENETENKLIYKTQNLQNSNLNLTQKQKIQIQPKKLETLSSELDSKHLTIVKVEIEGEKMKMENGKSDLEKNELEKLDFGGESLSEQNEKKDQTETKNKGVKSQSQINFPNSSQGDFKNFQKNLQDFADSSKNWTKNSETDSQRFFAAHRLDKDTQGLILFAKGTDNLGILQSEFRKRLVVKKYLAIVDGIVEQNFHVNNWQIRDSRNPVCQKFFWKEKEAREYDPMVKNAQSIIIPQAICFETGQTLIQVQILTGRMHQIRLQCQNLGFPLSSDPIYATKVGLEENFQNPKSLLNSPYLFPKNEAEAETLTTKFKHNFNSPKSDSTNSKQRKVSDLILQKIENKQMSQAISHNFDNSLEALLKKNLKVQNDGFYSFYGLEQVLQMSKSAFEKLKLEVFGDTEYCLLANFLGIQTPEFYLESEIFDLATLVDF